MEFGTSSSVASYECKDILLELITVTNELRNHIRFTGTTRDADETSMLGYDPDRLESLYRCIKRIFTHKIMIFTEKNEPDVWKVIQGLKFSNPAISLHVKRTRVCNVVSEDYGLLWIFQCVIQRSLSSNLNWLVTDKEHMRQCYESTAFLRDELYADAMMICFNALERGQPTLLSRIDPILYAQDQFSVFGSIKRSESHPNFLLEDILKSKQDKCALKRRQTIHHSNSRSNLQREKKSKVSRSLPNIALRDFYTYGKKKPPDSTDSNKENEVAGISVPNFCYGGNDSVPKPTLNVLNCENIKIYTDSSSNSSQLHENLQHNLASKRIDSQSKSDMFSLATWTGSPRVLLNEFIPQCGEKINKTNDNKSVGSILNEIPSRPVPGQSLTSFLKTVYFSRTNTELDRENAHFSLSEALIATFEQLKWNEEEAAIGRNTLRKLPSNSNFWSSYPGSPSYLGGGHKNNEELPNNISPSCASRESTSTVVSSLSNSGGSSVESGELQTKYLRQHSIPRNGSSGDEDDLEAVEASECDDVKSYSAEGVALSLLSKFHERQLPTACDLLWLVSEQDAPQQLLPMPPDGQIANPDDQNGLNTIIRGTREWAPPRPQIIFTYCSPWPDRRAQMSKQNNRCAGCGMKVAQAYSNRFRYCHYLGKYNCSGCHKNQMSAIPAKVIERWDFTFYPVSSFAYRLLNDVISCPLYRLNHLNPKLYEKVRVLQVARNIRKNLKYVQDFILNCRFADEMKGLFQNVPDHITSDLDSWSMMDFISVRNGAFQKQKTELIKRSENHIFECELCIAHGFFCENCDRKEIIFPWQKRVVKCSKCGACFHDTCWLSDCVKCDRLQRRRITKK